MIILDSTIDSITSQQILLTTINTSRGDNKPFRRKLNTTKIIKESRFGNRVGNSTIDFAGTSKLDSKDYCHRATHNSAPTRQLKPKIRETVSREEVVPIPAQQTTQQTAKVKGNLHN